MIGCNLKAHLWNCSMLFHFKTELKKICVRNPIPRWNVECFLFGHIELTICEVKGLFMQSVHYKYVIHFTLQSMNVNAWWVEKLSYSTSYTQFLLENISKSYKCQDLYTGYNFCFHLYHYLKVVCLKIVFVLYRCQASAVAVSIAIALMLQGKHKNQEGQFNVKNIIKECFEYASECLQTSKQKTELKTFLKCSNIKDLKLDEEGKIGYTYKSMGSGFWALKQDDFRKAITEVMMEVS